MIVCNFCAFLQAIFAGKKRTEGRTTKCENVQTCTKTCYFAQTHATPVFVIPRERAPKEKGFQHNHVWELARKCGWLALGARLSVKWLRRRRAYGSPRVSFWAFPLLNSLSRVPSTSATSRRWSRSEGSALWWFFPRQEEWRTWTYHCYQKGYRLIKILGDSISENDRFRINPFWVLHLKVTISDFQAIITT